MNKLFAVVIISCFASACATPAQEQAKKSGDNGLTCMQLKTEYEEAQDFEKKVRTETEGNTGVTQFFWPAMIGSYKTSEEALEAATERQKRLEKLGTEQKCAAL